MYRTIRAGAQVAEVLVLQARINAKPPSKFRPLTVDGIFGPKTLLRVKEFQRNQGMADDGIVGPLTWRKLMDGPVIHRQPQIYCDNINVVHRAASQTLAREMQPVPSASAGIALVSFPGLPKMPSLPKLPSLPKTRPLKGAPEEAIATAVYGSSIDTSSVTLTDKTGIGNRAFVVGVPNPMGRSFQIMNVGASPTPSTMIHELAHVWQSQHSSDPTQFMKNAVASQALEAAANLLPPTSKAWSAYGYRPGKPFSDYAAEQIAQQATRGEAAILAHMKGVAAWAIDPDNETGLKTPQIEDTSLPGIKS